MLCTPICILGQDKSQTKNTNNLESQKSKLYSVSKKSKQSSQIINSNPQWQKHYVFRI